MNTNTKYLTAIQTTAAMLFCSYLGVANVPERNVISAKKADGIVFALGTKTALGTSWGEQLNPYYQLVVLDKKIASEVDIIHAFVSKILEKSEDLDPKYAKVVDKYFWDLT